MPFGDGDRKDRIVVGALAEQIDRNDAARLQPEPFGGRDAALERGGIDIEGRLVDVDEDRRRADQGDGLAGRAEGEGRTQHGVAAADTLGHQHHDQRIGAARAGHDMLGAAVSGKRGLERGHFRAIDELAVRQHARDRLLHRRAEPAALGGDVDERNVFGAQLLVHGALRRLGGDIEKQTR